MFKVVGQAFFKLKKAVNSHIQDKLLLLTRLTHNNQEDMVSQAHTEWQEITLKTHQVTHKHNPVTLVELTQLKIPAMLNQIKQLTLMADQGAPIQLKVVTEVLSQIILTLKDDKKIQVGI